MFSFKKEWLISEKENISIQERNVDFAEKHTHEFFEFVYTQSGNCVHFIDDTEYRTKSGDMVFINRGQTHRMEGEGKIINILIMPEFIDNELVGEENIINLFRHSMFAEFGYVESPVRQCVHFEGGDYADTESLVNMIVKEYKNKQCGYGSVLHGCVRVLFTKVLRLLYSESNTPTCKNDKLFGEIMSYIDENYTQKISLSELARKAFYNPVYFSDLLKKHCGKSFSAYIKEKRIKKAAELLKQKNKSIEEIMAETGYGDKKLFYTHFKEFYNTTPGKFADM